MTGSGMHDLVVIGAGPAGGNAALSAAQAGLDVLVIDEASQPGGQVWRAPSLGVTLAADPDLTRGQAMRMALGNAKIPIKTGFSVWSVAPISDGFEIALASEGGPEMVKARRLLVATGAQERVVPFPGWTLPGVFGLAAATLMLKTENMLPGKRIVIAGQGPLLLAVAAKALKLGKVPIAVVDYNGLGAWLRSVAGFARHLPSFGQGLTWQAKLALGRVPIRRRSEITQAFADNNGLLAEIEIAPLGRGRKQRLRVDTAFIGNGLVPGDEILRLLGVKRVPDPMTGWRIAADAHGRCGPSGLYVAGDAGRIRGALPAAAQGRRVGQVIARDAGITTSFDAVDEAPEFERFADASCRLMQVDDARISTLPDEVILCRCEDVTVGMVRQAIAEGAQDANQLKHFTRLGMGPCQARMCGANAAALLRSHAKVQPGAEYLTPRSPIRPVDITHMAGQFDYADIPVPKPAPL
ncbi:FAD/NAD(P)-binding oxidoreductase [Roseinatronobacter bogoriensis subsp. barguzinensis]|uniref:FAD/NAD(P)-binding oxidoreductase n=2 Tax=Roseinatronobacter bogoriensis TaxID=119542 RepID=A0A2K8K505_9RHOB|nr:FAD/NAD(P)-binding oxidoreductase [Rhodobaca barguzinensis]